MPLPPTANTSVDEVPQTSLNEAASSCVSHRNGPGRETSIDPEPDTPSVVAVIVADPFDTAVSSPDVLVVATPSSEKTQVKVLPVIAFPLAS